MKFCYKVNSISSSYFLSADGVLGGRLLGNIYPTASYTIFVHILLPGY